MHDLEAARLHADRLAAVQGSFALVRAEAEINGHRLYERLAAEVPELRPILGDAPETHSARLMDMINMIVTAMGHLEATLPILRALAASHAEFGIRPEHYAKLGDILVDLMEEALGPAQFNPFVRESWQIGFTAVSRIMINAAYSETALRAADIRETVSPGLAPTRASS